MLPCCDAMASKADASSSRKLCCAMAARARWVGAGRGGAAGQMSGRVVVRRAAALVCVWGGARLCGIAIGGWAAPYMGSRGLRGAGLLCGEAV
jgi:hypothetical protein